MAGQLVAKNWQKIKEQVLQAQKKSKSAAKDVCIIGVSKLQDIDVINAGIIAGVKVLGENYVQELTQKMQYFSNEKLQWHLIGPLQSNKAKLVVGKVEVIQTLDRESLAQTISDLAINKKIKQKVMLQINVADEDSKNGINVAEVTNFCKKIVLLQGLEVVGLMTMPPFVDDAEKSRVHFRRLREIRDELNQNVFNNKNILSLSMGTSQDFEVAVEEGATHIRVGSVLFGHREK